MRVCECGIDAEDNFVDLLPVQGRKGASDLFICE